MKNFIILVFVVLISCSNKNDNNKNIVFSHGDYQMVIFKRGNQVYRFKFKNLKNNHEVQGEAELIKVNSEIPEGTNRIDNNNPKDTNGFECDSSYQFISNSIRLSFAIEKKNGRRLDLSIYHSTDTKIEKGDYTLVNERFEK